MVELLIQSTMKGTAEEVEMALIESNDLLSDLYVLPLKV